MDFLILFINICMHNLCNYSLNSIQYTFMHIRCNSNLLQFIAFLSFSGKYRINGFESNMQNRALEYFGKKCFFLLSTLLLFDFFHSLHIVWSFENRWTAEWNKIISAVAILVKFRGFLIDDWKIKTLNECEIMLKTDQLSNLTLIIHSLVKLSFRWIISQICHFHFHWKFSHFQSKLFSFHKNLFHK